VSAVLYPVRVRGRGEVEVPAYGVADAEHLVEKEVGRLWPGARVQISSVARLPGGGRIVEQFSLVYLLEGVLEVEAESQPDAHRAAFRAAREKLASSRYLQTRWEAVEAPPSA
jgi:hypothetical protein